MRRYESPRSRELRAEMVENSVPNRQPLCAPHGKGQEANAHWAAAVRRGRRRPLKVPPASGQHSLVALCERARDAESINCDGPRPHGHRRRGWR